MPPHLPRPARRRSIVLLAALLLAQGAAAGERVRIGGTGSGVGGMRVLGEAFMQAHPGVTVEVLPALGSPGGIAALLGGHIEIAVSNRRPRDAELAHEALVAFEYARTPFVVVVARRSGIASLGMAELAAIYREPAATFADGTRARPVLRPSDDADNELLRSFSPEVARGLDAALQRRGMLGASTDSEAADIAERTPGALAVSTLALVESEKRALTPLVIEGRVPSVENLANGSYPWFKPLYAVLRPGADPATRRFVEFMRSPEGRAVLRAHGHAPL